GPRMHRAMVNLYTTLRPQAGPGGLPKTTYQVVVPFRECPLYPIARLLNEHRPTTEGALQRALAPSLGAERARDEAGSLAGQMADACQNGGLAGFVPELSRRVANWQAAGVPEAAVEEALVTLARWPWLRDPAHPSPEVPLEDVLQREVRQREKFGA